MKRILAGLLFISQVSFGQVNLNLGLRAYYPFSGNANDVSGNNNNPVFNNATLTSDRLGNPNSAYHFNGTNTYMQVPDNATLNMGNKMSIALWVKATGYYTGPCYNSMLVMKSNPTTLPSNYFIRFADVYNGCTTPSTTQERFAGNSVVAATPFVQLNQWYSVVWTSDGVTEKIYVNCELKGSVPAGGVPYTNISDLLFGKNVDPAFPYWLDGDLDEVRIYDRALNQDEVNVLGGCLSPQSCNNWLRTQTVGESVKVGDLDVSGNKITVEGNFNCTAYPVSGANIFEEIVSKHSTFSDVNYALRMDMAAITTSNGFFSANASCSNILLNKTYHAAMVYDGATLKFYRDGFLLSEVPATGNLVLNNLLTTIGDYAYNNPLGTNFFGYLNEIRIWNVARTQAEIRTYMNSSLPNPTTQTGLLAYYTFDNLLNKQGNATWNGVLTGAATINNTNPNCNFTADSCPVITPISNIINDYTPVLGFNPCDNKLLVEDGTRFTTGDTVVIMQMKGAIIDSTNTAAFGTITDYKNAGNYEFNYVKSRSGNIIELTNVLTRQYDIPVGKVQLIRVPYYQSANITSTLTCLPWDGNKGGVLILNARDTVILNADVDVSGKGFRGGVNTNTLQNTLACNQTAYYYPGTSTQSAKKGEGITLINTDKENGRGKLANGGGGGNGHNSGGGGGSNAGTGGFGGYQLDNCGSAPFDNRGTGGTVLIYNSAANKIFMGGGGGAGHYDGPTGVTHMSNGGNGGGIVIINTNYLKTNALKLKANGNTGEDCIQQGFPCNHDGMAGGGAGGVILLNINNFIDNNSINTIGGKGANLEVYTIAAGRVAPGGGGSGGISWFKSATLPANSTIVNAGGINGVIVPDGNNPWGATAGLNGSTLFNLQIPIATVPFKKNIDSVRIKDSATSCVGFDFKGLGYFNTNAINTWQWYFGDGGLAATQNTSHNYLIAGTYTVKLVVTDINGCKDSIQKNVTTIPLIADAGNDTLICSAGGPVVVTLHAGPGTSYAWTPTAYLNNPAIQNPVATISVTTVFYVTINNSLGCSGSDSVKITLTGSPNVKTLVDTAICRGSILVLTTTTGLANYHWSPGIYVSDSTISNPLFIDTQSRTLYITASNGPGCSGSDTINVTVKPLPVVKTIADTIICSNQTVTLFTSGALSYSWSPAINLSNPTIASPVFSGTNSQTYYVTGTAVNGCKAIDTVTIFVNTPFSMKTPPDKSTCQGQSVQLDGFNGNTVQYLWTPPVYLDNNRIINPIASPPITFPYILLITDQACNYSNVFVVLVTVNPKPVPNATKSNDIDCAKRFANLSASGGTQYLWTPSIGLSNPNVANPIATPQSTQKYYVTVTNSSGCSGIDSVTVQMNLAASLARYLPTAFTPNGDGLNDCYGIKNWMKITRLQFGIFNRFGERVFYTTDPATCWDGNFRGKKADPGAYVYYVKASTDCGDVDVTGNLILIR